MHDASNLRAGNVPAGGETSTLGLPAAPDLYRALLDSMTEGVSLSTAEGVIVYTNPAEDRIFGYGRGELIGCHVSVQNDYPDEENRRIVAEVMARLKEEGYWEGEWRNRRKDGTSFVTASRITAVTLEGRRYWLCVQRDVSEAKRIDDALRESESRLRLAVEAGRMAVWEWDAATDWVRPSPELNVMLGFPEDHRLTREEVAARYYPGEHERLRAAARAALAAGERFFEVEFRFGFPGPPRWLLLRAEIMLGDNGTPAGVIGVLLDISERERAREQVQELEQELRAALSAASFGTYVVDHVTGEVRTSAGLNAIYGYSDDRQLTLEDLRARYHPEDAEWIRTTLGESVSTDVSQHEVEMRLLLPDGTTKWVFGKGEYVRDEAGQLVKSRGVVLDITDRKRYEEHLQLLVHELNHRVKNTLATVQSIVMQSLRNARTPDGARVAIDGRLQALARAHDVLTRENWERAELRQLTAHALAPYNEIGRGRLHVSGPAVDLPPRMALALAMAFQELATNAVKYGALSVPAGSIAISWSVETDGPRSSLRLRWEESGGPSVQPPKRRGFGTRLIERSLAQDLDGSVRILFAPTGLQCAVEALLPDSPGR